MLWQKSKMLATISISQLTLINSIVFQSGDNTIDLWSVDYACEAIPRRGYRFVLIHTAPYITPSPLSNSQEQTFVGQLEAERMRAVGGQTREGR